MPEAAAFFFPAARASAGGLNAGSAPAGAAGRDQTFAAILGPQAGDPTAAPPAGASPAPPTTGLIQPGSLTPLLSADGALSFSAQAGIALAGGLSPVDANTSASVPGSADALFTTGLTAWPAGPLPQLNGDQPPNLAGQPQASLPGMDMSMPNLTGSEMTQKSNAPAGPVISSAEAASAVQVRRTAPSDKPLWVMDSVSSTPASGDMNASPEAASGGRAIAAAGESGVKAPAGDPRTPGALSAPQQGAAADPGRPDTSVGSPPTAGAAAALQGVSRADAAVSASETTAGEDPDGARTNDVEAGDEAGSNARQPMNALPALAVPAGAGAAPPTAATQAPMIPMLTPAASPPVLQDATAASPEPVQADLPDMMVENRSGATAGETPNKASASGVKASPGEAAIGQAAVRVGIPEAQTDRAPEIPGASHARPMAGSEASGSLSGASHPPASSAAAHSQAAHMSAPPATLQVYTRFIERFDGRAQRFEVRLDPAELGRIDVRIEVGSDKKVRALLAAHDSAALNDLMRGQRALERMLADAGVDVAEGGITFEMAGDQGRNAPSEDGRSAPARPDVWRRFGSVDVPVDTEVERAVRPWLPTRLDLVA